MSYEERQRQRFHNLIRILRSLDKCEVTGVRDWRAFRDDPCEYVIKCSDEDMAVIWAALRKREKL